MKEMRKLLLRIALSLAVFWGSSYLIEAIGAALLKMPVTEMASYTAILGIDLLCSWIIGGWLVKKVFGE